MIIIAVVASWLPARRRPGRHTRTWAARHAARQWQALDREWAAALAECAARQDARRLYTMVGA